jgi:hypothetical protein
MNARAIPLEAIYERDVDLLLLEELSVSTAFASWLVSQTHPSDIQFSSLEAGQHSVVELGRESDLVLVFVDLTGSRRALLIENKIDAPPQPDQSAGYSARANAGVVAGRWKGARTCIVAPEAYLIKDNEARGYNAQVSYEAIAQWFDDRANSDLRYRYRATVVRDAIEQSRRSRVADEDKDVTAFWYAYWKDVSSLYPELEFREPGPKSSGSTWIQFVPQALNKTRTIDHKLQLGYVDLSMTNIAAGRRDEFRQRFRPIIAPHAMTVEITCKSLAIRSAVPKLDLWQDYANQRAAALVGMKAAYRAWVLAGTLDPAPSAS